MQPIPSQESNEIHVPGSERGFGLGFGGAYQVTVYTGNDKVSDHFPKTSALLTQKECDRVLTWAANPHESITNVISPVSMAEALPNLLIHHDTIDMVRLMPKILAAMTPQQRRMLCADTVERIRDDVWKEITDTRPYLLVDKMTASAYLRPLSDKESDVQITTCNVPKKNGERRYDDITFNGVSMELLVFILPLVFETLDDLQRVQFTQAFADAMHKIGEDKNFFAPLADVNRNRIVFTDGSVGVCNNIINNGRTIKLQSTQGPKLRFQGETYSSVDLHFHPLKNVDPKEPVRNINGEVDNKPEFQRYHNALHQKSCKEDPKIDANRNTVGQLHLIYSSVESGRAMLLGADVVLGAENPEIGKYIAFLQSKLGGEPLPIINNTKDEAEVKKKAVPANELLFDPFACFGDKRFDRDGLPEAPFISPHLGGLRIRSFDDVRLREDESASPVFYRGVRVVHLPEPITISEEQLGALRKLQPVLKKLDEDTCVHPQQRFSPMPGLMRLIKDERSHNSGRLI